MNATRGMFDSTAERLVMQDKITIATSSGVSGEMTHATLDMTTQTLRSHRPVYFKTAGGTVRANALTFRSADSTLTFRGKPFPGPAQDGALHVEFLAGDQVQLRELRLEHALEVLLEVAPQGRDVLRYGAREPAGDVVDESRIECHGGTRGRWIGPVV